MSQFPSIISRSQAASPASNDTVHSITLPSSILAGDLVIICFSVDASENPAVTTGTNWTRLDYLPSSTACTGSVFYKVFTVNGPETVVITTTTEQSSHICFKIRGHNPVTPIIYCTSVAGDSTNADPPSHTPGYVTQDYLWIIYCAHDAQVVATACDANFSNLTTQAAAGSAGASTSVADRSYRVGTAYNPGAFTSNTEQCVAFTICINPILGCGMTARGTAALA